MGLLSGSMEGLGISKSRRQSNASSMMSGPPGGGGASVSGLPGGGTGDEAVSTTGDGSDNSTSQLDKEEGNILMSLISQLRPGMDLSKIALPTFVLEPRSLLERITDFFSHPELIFGAAEEPDAKDRFMRVMTFYLSGWHIKPKGVKKPYNPVLGEFFRCSYFYEDGSEGYYIAEQVSHHPPVSAFFYVSPRNGLLVTGELKPKSKFLGNSAATIMEGEDRIRLLNKPEDGEYVITMPNTYARGILFGKLILELCDLSSIDNSKTDYHCDVEFKAKGWISGGYNVIGGHVKGPHKTDVGEITGHWHSAMEFQDRKGKKSTIFDANTAKSVPKSVIPESEQEEYESRRLWSNLTDAIKSQDMYGATAAKTAVEDKQRELARKRESEGKGIPEPRFFRHASGDRWMPKLDVDNLPKDVDEMEKMVVQWIFGDKKPARSNKTSGVGGGGAQTGGHNTPPTTATSPQHHEVNLSPGGSPTSLKAPPSVPTAPGPPAPGPKASHPIPKK